MSQTDEYSFILKPSPLHGVGVFVTHKILKGTRLNLIDNDDIRIMPNVKAPFKRYCVELSGNRYIAPGSFSKMSIGMYLNHSTDANVIMESEDVVKNENFFATRDIDEGGELLIDYSASFGEDVSSFLPNKVPLIDPNDLNQHSMNVRFTWSDIWDAFARGIKEGQLNPDADDKDIQRASDCYCKLVQLEKYKKDNL